MTEEELNAEDKVVVSLNNKKDKQSFCEELAGQGNVSSHIPSREVEIKNIRAECWYTLDCFMSRREMIELEKDPRVSCCRFGSNNFTYKTTAHRPPNPDQFPDVMRGHNHPWKSAYNGPWDHWYPGDVYSSWGQLHVNLENKWLDHFPQDNQGQRDRHTAEPAPAGSNARKTQINYTLTGKGVDIVIMDSGIARSHEWENELGQNRLRTWPEHKWPTMSSNTYAKQEFDYDGHGTHAASAAAGKNYGSATESLIYSMAIDLLGSQPADAAASRPETTAAFNDIRIWHESKNAGLKPGQEGYRPTIINCSWAAVLNWGSTNASTTSGNAVNNINSITYRGVSHTCDNSSSGETNSEGNPIPKSHLNNRKYGVGRWDHLREMGDPTADPPQDPNQELIIRTDFPAHDPTNSAVRSCLEAGIIVSVGAGNSNYYACGPGSSDWNNKVDLGYPHTDKFYHKGSIPRSINFSSSPGSNDNDGELGVIVIGNLDGEFTDEDASEGTPANEERKDDSSGYGPRVDAFAPGGHTPVVTSHEHRTEWPWFVTERPGWYLNAVNPHYTTETVEFDLSINLPSLPYVASSGQNRIRVKDRTVFQPGDKILVKDVDWQVMNYSDSTDIDSIGTEYTVQSVHFPTQNAGDLPTWVDILGLTYAGVSGWYYSSWFFKCNQSEISDNALYYANLETEPNGWWMHGTLGWIFLGIGHSTFANNITSVWFWNSSVGYQFASSETINGTHAFTFNNTDSSLGKGNSWLYWANPAEDGATALVYNYGDEKYYDVNKVDGNISGSLSTHTGNPPPKPKFPLIGELQTSTTLTANIEGNKPVSLTNERIGWGSGTSIAGPTAVGIIACWLEADPTLSIHDIRKLLRGNHSRHDVMYDSPFQIPPAGNTSGSYDAYANIYQTGGANRIIRQPDNSGQPMKRRSEN